MKRGDMGRGRKEAAGDLASRVAPELGRNGPAGRVVLQRALLRNETESMQRGRAGLSTVGTVHGTGTRGPALPASFFTNGLKHSPRT